MSHKPNIKFKTIKLPEDNIGENLGDLRFGDSFLRYNIKGMINEINLSGTSLNFKMSPPWKIKLLLK